MFSHNQPQPPATSNESASTNAFVAEWRFDHLSVSMGADHALRRLFEGVMGFQTGFRPPFPFPGRWLYQDKQAVLHAIDDTSLSADAGELRFNHIAFTSTQPASTVIAQLQTTAFPFKVARIPEDSIAQIFVQLPGNFVVELDVPDDTDRPPSHVYSATCSAPSADNF